MTRPGIWAVVAALALLGCRDEPPKPPDMAEVLPNLPLPPHAALQSQSGGADALMITFRSPTTPRAVEAYYRSVFTGAGWRLVKHSTDPSGAVTMLAEQDGPPLWVRIRGTADSMVTMVDLAGAVVAADSTKAARPAS